MDDFLQSTKQWFEKILWGKEEMELNLHSVDAYLDMEIVLMFKCLWSRQTSNEGNLLHLTSLSGTWTLRGSNRHWGNQPWIQ